MIKRPYIPPLELDLPPEEDWHEAVTLPGVPSEMPAPEEEPAPPTVPCDPPEDGFEEPMQTVPPPSEDNPKVR